MEESFLKVVKELRRLAGQLRSQGYRSHRLGAPRRGLQGEGCSLDIPLRPERIGRGERREPVERRVQFTPELERVEALIEDLELVAFVWGQDAGGAEALERRLGAVVDPVHAGVLPALGDELFHRLEEVDVGRVRHV